MSGKNCEIRKKKDSQWLIQNIRHLVLETLSRNEGVNQIPPILFSGRHDLPTRTADVRVDIERFPQVVYRHWTRHSTYIEQNTKVGLEDGAESVEEPSMRVDLLLVLLFKAKDDLDGYSAFFCAFDFEAGVDGDWGGA